MPATALSPSATPELEQEPTSSVVAMSTAIYFQNNCAGSIHAAVRHKTAGGDWVTTDWTQLDSGVTLRVARSPGRTYFRAVAHVDPAAAAAQADPSAAIFFAVGDSETLYPFTMTLIPEQDRGLVTLERLCPRD